MNQEENHWGPKETFNAAYAIASIYSTCVLPFLRTGMGSHALGFNAFFAGVGMVFAGGLLGAPEMLNFVGVWLAAVVVQRVSGAWGRARRREPVHSRYLGDPVLARLPGVTPHAARGVLEPVVTFAAALAVAPASGPTGGFLMGAAAALFVKNLVDVEADRARVRRLRDAHLEQVYVSRRFREGERP